MKEITVLATTYTAKQFGDVDIRGFRVKNAFRYRQDIFPAPDGFKLQVAEVVPDIVETGDGVYPYRLRLTVRFTDDSDDAAIMDYKAAIERRTKRFEVVRDAKPKRPEPGKPEPAPVPEKPEAPKPEPETPETEKKPEAAPAKAKTKKGRKGKK